MPFKYDFFWTEKKLLLAFKEHALNTLLHQYRWNEAINHIAIFISYNVILRGNNKIGELSLQPEQSLIK